MPNFATRSIVNRDESQTELQTYPITALDLRNQ